MNEPQNTLQNPPQSTAEARPPLVETTTLLPRAATPSPARQSWGAVISIFIIVLMVVIGAFYSWGERIAQQENAYPPAQSR